MAAAGCKEQVQRGGRCRNRRCAGIGGGPAHLPSVGDDAPGAQDIVRVRGSFIGNDAPERDVGGLVDGELGALDEVREVGFEEGQRRVRIGKQPTDPGRRPSTVLVDRDPWAVDPNSGFFRALESFEMPAGIEQGRPAPGPLVDPQRVHLGHFRAPCATCPPSVAATDRSL